MSDQFKVEVEVLDGQPITKRTGVAKVTGVTGMSRPVKGRPYIVMYDKDQATHPTDPSPGMVTFPDMVESLNEEHRFFDEQGRPFKVKYL